MKWVVDQLAVDQVAIYCFCSSCELELLLVTHGLKLQGFANFKFLLQLSRVNI